MTDLKVLIDFVSQHWPMISALFAVPSLLVKFLKTLQVTDITVRTKDKGQFYIGWDHEKDQTDPIQVEQIALLPEAPKSSKRKKADR